MDGGRARRVVVDDDPPPPYRDGREPSPTDRGDAAGFDTYDPPGGRHLCPARPWLARLRPGRAPAVGVRWTADGLACCAGAPAGYAAMGPDVSPVSYGSLYSIERLLAAGGNLAADPLARAAEDRCSVRPRARECIARAHTSPHAD